MNTPKKSQNPWRNHCVSSFDEKHWQGSVDTNLCQTTQRIISAHRTKSFPTLPSLVKRVLPLKHLWNHYIYVYTYIFIHTYSIYIYTYIYVAWQYDLNILRIVEFHQGTPLPKDHHHVIFVRSLWVGPKI